MRTLTRIELTGQRIDPDAPIREYLFAQLACDLGFHGIALEDVAGIPTMHCRHVMVRSDGQRWAAFWRPGTGGSEERMGISPAELRANRAEAWRAAHPGK